jgi:hypothetical protein
MCKTCFDAAKQDLLRGTNSFCVLKQIHCSMAKIICNHFGINDYRIKSIQLIKYKEVDHGVIVKITNGCRKNFILDRLHPPVSVPTYLADSDSDSDSDDY